MERSDGMKMPSDWKTNTYVSIFDLLNPMTTEVFNTHLLWVYYLNRAFYSIL